MSDNAIVVHNQQSNILTRIGAPQERQYLIQIMAEQMGIPASEATRTDVIALLGAAAQHTMQFGWIPGIHTHVQKFESPESKARRSKDQTIPASYTYTLVVGEKAWKDSGTRWRERGVQWRYQRKPMTPQEVAEEARLQGFGEKVAGNSYGFWSRIIVMGQDDPQNDDDPTWSAGVWFGKIKTGQYWREDALPTGVSARDVAMRRADKRAMTQSTLTLLPLDDLSPEARIGRLADNLRGEAEVRGRLSAPMPKHLDVVMEDDGDAIWAIEPSKEARARPAQDTRVHGQEPAPENVSARPRFDEEDFWGGDVIAVAGEVEEAEEPSARPVHGQEPAPENPSARPPEPASARPDDRAEKCPVCFAPPGKAHTKKCTNQNASARPEQIHDPEPAPSSARPEVSPENPSARPAEFVQKPLDQNERIYARLTTIYGSSIPLTTITKEFIRHCRNSDSDSAMSMSALYYQAIIDIMGERLGATENEVDMMVAVLCGYMPTVKRLPGQLVHGYLIRNLREGSDRVLEALAEIMELCQEIYLEETSDGE